ncbi:aminodeoxychorismate synthase component I [Streptomyces actinomycinicus]|uniref:Aminodeoxychorismate synthase n=1 Tax=Streptomyces actinomycinicus TaxID=1695166 RepID=A0A937ENF5_9ACTN|nr:aminodeoxychorismate synthase component I [Streptomyces actinomycinicus]MBL1086542.1 aminodeoxychorismate synthase component I [Streptomyces actinomycinicus]
MRTLIIDNYDSFTYNLFHDLAVVNGTEPVVMRNDDPAWHRGLLDEFDNVVLSPGPGHPGRAGDFGICAEIVASARIPLLGVCLGHQGIAQILGGSVVPAPEVSHGRTSLVSHTGEGLFQGLPTPFTAVRYHSLAIGELPADLEAVAWCEEGVVMGIRHRERCLWGVQFHPESVCTEHGRLLMRNFRDLTRRQNGRTTYSAAAAAAEPAPSLAQRPPAPQVPFTHRLIARTVTSGASPETVFDRRYAAATHAFWLDSGAPGPGTGRFSFMGDARGPLARVAAADVEAATVTVTGADGTHVVDGPFFDWLDEDLARHRTQVPPLPFDFAAGWVGCLGYELKAECGGDLVHRSARPDAVMIFADRIVAHDHETGLFHLLALAETGREEAAHRWLDDTEQFLTADALLTVEPPAGLPPAGLGPLTLRHDRSRYLELISLCQKEIEAGETYEVCLTNTARVAGRLEPWPAYRQLRAHSPAPYGAFLRWGSTAVLSSSPERFLHVTSDGTAESRPIKGTRPRGATPERDEALRRELAGSAKDRAENLMIVDLVRNDLGSCAEPGSVRTAPLFDVETYATVHQLVSTVSARLRSGVTAVGAVRACFPGGSMTGAPKIRTMQIIDRLENGPRGLYSGALGYFSLSGAADLSIVIRTLVAGDEEVEFGVGGAVIALSEPAAEFEETRVKATGLLKVVGRTFPDAEGDGR